MLLPIIVVAILIAVGNESPPLSAAEYQKYTRVELGDVCAFTDKEKDVLMDLQDKLDSVDKRKGLVIAAVATKYLALGENRGDIKQSLNECRLSFVPLSFHAMNTLALAIAKEK